MILLGVFGACVHTPPHDAWAPGWSREVRRRDVTLVDGTSCLWETEVLRVGDQVLWGEDMPGGEDEDWCVEPVDQARWFDVESQDGPFLSTVLVDGPPRCVTWNLATGRPATLAEYDPVLAERRLRRARELVATRPAYAGAELDPDAFVVAGGHVVFCGRREGEIVRIPVR